MFGFLLFEARERCIIPVALHYWLIFCKQKANCLHTVLYVHLWQEKQ